MKTFKGYRLLVIRQISKSWDVTYSPATTVNLVHIVTKRVDLRSSHHNKKRVVRM